MMFLPLAQLDFTADKTEAPLPIPIVSDSTPEVNGSITVTLEADSPANMTYSIGTSNSATVMVNDDDSLPVLTITGPTTPVAESVGSVDFVINTNKELGEDVQIRYQASEVLTGDFLNENATPSSQEAIAWQTVDFSGSAGSYSATLSVPIHNDLIV